MASKTIECPFCGCTARSTDEHVWAQWLHRTTGARYLLEGSHGARLPQEHVTFHEGNDGTLQATQTQVGYVAELLPNVKVRVCEKCNSGWMSRLEKAAQASLGPYIFNETPHVKLSRQAVEELATWAAKSFMAYCLTRSDHQNPFTIRDYRAISENALPPDRCALWLMSSHHPHAKVAMGVHSTYFSPVDAGDEDLAIAPDNFALAFLSVGCCVFVMMRWPNGMTQEIRDALAPPQLRKYGTRQIWPNPRPQFFPIDDVPDHEFDQLLKFPESVLKAIGLPALGLTADERAEALQRFRDGETPSEIRSRWGQ